MRSSMLGLAAISTALLTGPAGATETAEPIYQISLDIRDSGKLVASPSLRVRSGEAASLVSDDGSGQKFSITVRVSPAGSEMVSLDSTIDITTASGKHSVGKPGLTTRLGQRAALQYGDEAGIMVEVTLSEAKRSD